MIVGSTVAGVFLHAVGGFAAGSFYIPFKKVRGWSWETYWLVGGVFSWIVAPLIIAFLTVEDLPAVLADSPLRSLLWTYVFGVLWGIGGLTFGLSMRYLGFSLGYALTLGFCAALGTLIPPLFRGELLPILGDASGRILLFGVFVCLTGIAICARAGMLKESEISSELKRQSVAEFNFVKGIWIAVFAGVMSACMAFAFAAGKPIAAAAVQHGTRDLFQNNAVLVIVLLGGITTNVLWCAYLHTVNKSWSDYLLAGKAPLVSNYVFSAIAGVTWYLQFFFYGMGTTKMGEYDFASWTLHMAFIMIFGNLWGLIFREWRGTSRKTRLWIHAGLVVLVVSTIIVGYAKNLTGF